MLLTEFKVLLNHIPPKSSLSPDWTVLLLGAEDPPIKSKGAEDPPVKSKGAEDPPVKSKGAEDPPVKSKGTKKTPHHIQQVETPIISNG